MPGAYAHITLVNHLRLSNHLESIEGFDPYGATAVMDYFKFCELGAVSPDYPYLVPMDKKACAWADFMHYTNTGDVIKAGIRQLAKMQRNDDWRKAFAWLCGYASHVGADMTIHPVVELKVGAYAQNKQQHRVCELNQDSHIFQRFNLGNIGLAEYLDTGIGGCCTVSDSGELDAAVASLWKSMLRERNPADFLSNPPDMNKWHKCFKTLVAKIAEDGNKLLPAARHLAVDSGMVYPAVKDIDSTFIHSLRVPGGQKDYDEIFDIAIENVKTVWSLIWKGVFAGDKSFETRLGKWNLDTGRDENNQLVFWN